MKDSKRREEGAPGASEGARRATGEDPGDAKTGPLGPGQRLPPRPVPEKPSAIASDHACDFPGTEKRIVAARGIDFWVETEGGGPPLLLVHGGPGSEHRYFHPGLSGLGRRLVYYDLRGHGMSSEPMDGREYGLETDADDLEGLRLALGLGQVDVMGHSYGGLVALSCAARHPGSIRKLLVCSTPVGATNEDITARCSDDPRDREARQQGFEGFVRFYYERPPDAETLRFARLAYERFGCAKNRRLLAARESAAAGDVAWAPLLDRVRCPTLFLYGAWDPIVVPARLEQAVVGRPLQRTMPFPSSRHDPWVDEPGAFLGAVEDFLST